MTIDKGNRVGFRYLFDSKGCSLANLAELTTSIDVSGKYNARVYLGAKPRHGIHIVSGGSKYFVPGVPCSLGTSEFKTEMDPSSEHGPFFLEIEVSTEADVIPPDGKVIEHLLRQAQTRRDEFGNVIHLIAGIVGLRFHRQFVLEPLNENALAWEGDMPARAYAGHVVENLEPICLNDNGIEYLETLKRSFASLPLDCLEKYGTIFHWLLRAWQERDDVYTFVDLFVALESLLNAMSDSEMSSEDKSRAEALRVLIRRYAPERSQELLCFVDKLVQHLRPTLGEAFNDLATKAKLQGWEADIEAFRKFKRMRNVLLHGVDEDVQQRVTVAKEEVRTLSDLVERYINWALFRDNNVYRSRWRPPR